MCKKRHKRCFRVCGRVMSTKSVAYPNLTHDVSLAGGTDNAQVKPWLGRTQVQLEKGAGKTVRGKKRAREGSNPSAGSGWGLGKEGV